VAAPVLFLLYLSTSVLPGNPHHWLWLVGMSILLLVGHAITRNTPWSTEAGIERRTKRVELNRTGFADRFWLVVMNLLATLSVTQLAGQLLLHHSSAFRDVVPDRVNWLTTVGRILFPLAVSMGAWHRTRWGFKPERLGNLDELEPPLVGRTAANIGLVICIALLVLIVGAVVVQFVPATTSLNQLWR
jgi:hypothetical protein